MKLDELRAALRDPKDADPETEGPVCVCCGKRSARMLEHPIHGAVCFWCHAECYDLLADRFDHARALRNIEDALTSARRCTACGELRKADVEVSGIHVIHPCACGHIDGRT